jgi:hypothetical protein
MNFRRVSRSSRVLSFAAVLALLPLTASLAGCAGGDAPKMATVKAGDMPEGEAWTGVYFHPVFGYLHMVENGTTIVGKWKRADQSKWGELNGTKLGNVFHFVWKEHTYGLVGPAAETHGKGVFVYSVEENSTNHKTAKLAGQFGLNDDEVGSTWDCVKQDRMEPKLDSITGDQSATGAPAAAGNWDEK